MMNTTIDITKVSDYKTPATMDFRVLSRPDKVTYGNVDHNAIKRILTCVGTYAIAYWHYLPETSAGVAYGPTERNASLTAASSVPELETLYSQLAKGQDVTFPRWWPSFMACPRKPQVGQTLKGLILHDTEGRDYIGSEHTTGVVTHIEGNMVKTSTRIYHIQLAE